jgi:RNA 3'-terminal phosphate cyclase (ATP)
MLEIDGSRGEGGGQVLRTSLALSIVTGAPFRMTNVRANRESPGLKRQHLAALKAAARVGAAEVEGAAVGSREVVFRPGAIVAGRHEIDIGTAGSATLVFQTLLPALLRASEPSTLVITGGTHNPLAPTFDFLDRAFVPLVRRMGPRVTLTLERAGFYPRGGGRIRAAIEPAPLAPLALDERGAIRARTGVARVAALPLHIAEREVETLERKLRWGPGAIRAEPLDEAWGPGNVVVVTVESEHVTEVFSAVGEKGVRAEVVARACAEEVEDYLAAGVPVGRHLADQLILLLALGGGSFTTLPLTGHSETQLEVVKLFLPVALEVEEVSEKARRIRVR